jgi:Enoyl-CoA hydratase/isomerase
MSVMPRWRLRCQTPGARHYHGADAAHPEGSGPRDRPLPRDDRRAVWRQSDLSALVRQTALRLSLGLVNRVVPDEQLHDVTMELARSLAHGPAVALALMKRNMNCAESGGLAELLDMEAAHQVETGRTEDHRQAAKAFVEKRAPVFVGR